MPLRRRAKVLEQLNPAATRGLPILHHRFQLPSISVAPPAVFGCQCSQSATRDLAVAQLNAAAASTDSELQFAKQGQDNPHFRHSDASGCTFYLFSPDGAVGSTNAMQRIIDLLYVIC